MRKGAIQSSLHGVELTLVSEKELEKKSANPETISVGLSKFVSLYFIFNGTPERDNLDFKKDQTLFGFTSISFSIFRMYCWYANSFSVLNSALSAFLTLYNFLLFYIFCIICFVLIFQHDN